MARVFSKDPINPTHYTDMAITPREYNIANKLGWDEANVVKYVSRHKTKNGREDIEKAIKYCQLILESYDSGDEICTQKES